MKFVFSIVCFFCISFIYAQIGGRTTYEFLNLPVSPKVSALGGKNITLYNDDPSSAIVNPSLVNYKMDNNLSVNYMSYLSDINYGTASYAYLIDRRTQVVHASMTYVDYGSFDGYDENGNSTSSFSGNEASLQFGYATQIGRSDFYAGANMRFITSKLEQYSSFAASVDLGVSYIYEDWDLIVSGVIRNAGYQFKAYDEMRENLPFEVVLGVSQMLENVPIRWHLTYDHAQIWNVAFGNTNRDEVDLEGNVSADDPGFLIMFCAIPSSVLKFSQKADSTFSSAITLEEERNSGLMTSVPSQVCLAVFRFVLISGDSAMPTRVLIALEPRVSLDSTLSCKRPIQSQSLIKSLTI